jgi:hypothetical protein
MITVTPQPSEHLRVMPTIRRDPFEAAVPAYMSSNSDMPHADAARAAADIICHRW